MPGLTGSIVWRLSLVGVQRASSFFCATSWREGYKLLIFIHIVERRKTDIFSPFVFNNIVEHTLFFTPPRFAPAPSQAANKTCFFKDLQVFEFPSHKR
jgi:hypothetical protein